MQFVRGRFDMGVSRVRVKKEPMSEVQVKLESEEQSPRGLKRTSMLEGETDSSAIESALFSSPPPAVRDRQAPLSASSVFSSPRFFSSLPVFDIDNCLRRVCMCVCLSLMSPSNAPYEARTNSGECVSSFNGDALAQVPLQSSRRFSCSR